MDGNSMIPWPPLPLEPGIYGGGELVSSYSFGTNKSLDAGFFSYGSSLMLPNIQEPRTNDHPVRSHFYQSWAYNDTGVFFRRVHDNHSSRRESFRSRSNRRTRRHKRPHRVIFRGHMKLLRVHGSSTTKQAPLRHRRRRVLLVVDRTAATTRIAVGLALFGLLCTVAGLVLWCLRKNSEDEEEAIIQQTELCPSSGPRRYSYRELAAATGRFAEEERIGRGGFGPVYRGFLADQDRRVAIKVMMMSQGSPAQAQGMREFQAEVTVMTRLRHRNIVQLLGWCDGPKALMLVYEFLPNGSLDKHLHDPERLLTWSDRYYYLNTDRIDR